jgi:hypothetical protein
MRSFSSSLLVSGVLAIALMGCNSGGGGGGTALVEVGITAQALEVTVPSSGGSGSGSGSGSQRHLAVTVSDVLVHVAAHGADHEAREGAAPRAGESGWFTVFSGKTRVDLLDAITTEALLDSVTVPAGKITQVRIVLTDAELIEGTKRTAVSCPSCSETGLKIVTEGKVEAAAGDTLHLALDFDQARSLTLEEGVYRLGPVIKVARVDED